VARHKKRSKTPQEPYAPPRSWRGGPFVWLAGVDLIEGGLNSLPFGYRGPKRHVPAQFKHLVAPPGRKLPPSAFPHELRDAKEVVDALLEKDYAAACKQFNTRLASASIPLCLPLLAPTPPRHYARMIVQGTAWQRHKTAKHTFLPPAFSLWLILSSPEAYPRIRRCKECCRYFWARNLQRTRYCSNRCRIRSTVAASREHSRIV